MKRQLSRNSLSDHVNYRYLSTPEKIDRLHQMQRQKKAMAKKISRLKDKIANAVAKADTVSLDEEMSADLCQVMIDEQAAVDKLPVDSFQRIFWKQQKESMEKHKNGMRWHPLMIRWCLYLRHMSSKAYETLRDSGCIHLPSQRTLRDYSHCVKSGAGFTADVDDQLIRAAKLSSESPEWHKLVIILIDEMHVKEGLVYNKHSGKMIGFVDLGEVNNQLIAFEQSLESSSKAPVPVLANSMLVMMVRGIFTQLRYVYAQFPRARITGDLLFLPFWKAVCRLERIGFKVNNYHMHSLQHLFFYRYWEPHLMAHQLTDVLLHLK